MSNNYQKNAPRTTAGLRLALPETVSVAMAEIAEDMQDGLLALAVGAGLQVMSALMEADVTAETTYLVLREHDQNGLEIASCSKAITLTGSLAKVAVTGTAARTGDTLDVYVSQSGATAGDAFTIDAVSLT